MIINAQKLIAIRHSTIPRSQDDVQTTYITACDTHCPAVAAQDRANPAVTDNRTTTPAVTKLEELCCSMGACRRTIVFL